MGKVLFINGSPNKSGCTATAMEEVIASLKKEGIDSELVILNLCHHPAG